MSDLFAIGGLGHLKVEQVEDVLSPADRTAGQAARQDLGKGRQIGRDAVFGLRPIRRHAKSGHELIEN